MNLVIMVVFSPLDSGGCYTDIYTDHKEAEIHDLGYGIAVGFCVLDTKTGLSPDEALDFCETVIQATEDYDCLTRMYLGRI